MTPGGDPALAFIIVNWNTRELLLGCLKSIGSTVKKNPFEIWLVDNGSTDGSVEAVRKLFPAVNIIENGANLGFAKANNLALSKMAGKYAVLLNTDAVLDENAIDAIMEFMEKNPDVAVCGGQLLNADGSRQNSIANFPSLLTELTNKSLLRLIAPGKYPGKERHFQAPVEVESVIGACMAVRKKAIDETGLLDEDYFFFLEETDWCLRFRKKGWKVFHHPGARIWHLQGQSAGKTLIRTRIEYWKSRYIYFKKHARPVEKFMLRAGLLIRLLIGFSLNFLYNLLTFFSLKKGRKKQMLYGALLAWHVLGCPGSWGFLRPAKKTANER